MGDVSLRTLSSSATKTEPVRANPLGVTLDSNTKKIFIFLWVRKKKNNPKKPQQEQKTETTGGCYHYLKVAAALSSSTVCLGTGFGDSCPCSS